MSIKSPIQSGGPETVHGPGDITGSNTYEVAVTATAPTFQQPVRLQKKRSDLHDQSVDASRNTDTPSPVVDRAAPKSPTTRLSTQTQRKSSLRNAVRRMFGRRPKSTVVIGGTSGAAVDTSVKHAHSPSDPGILNKVHETRVDPTQIKDEPAHRSFSLPSKPRISPTLSNVRPVNAVEFPQSARLKPLDLENPFRVKSRKRERRATLPSLVLDELTANIIARVLNEKDQERRSSAAPRRDNRSSQQDIGVAITTPANRHNRRSRSVDDLRRLIHSVEPARPRNEEIEFWRRSFAGSILRHPPSQEPEGYQDDEYLSAIEDAVPLASGPREKGFSVTGSQKADRYDEQQVRPRSDTPVDTDIDLFARVARLEMDFARLDSRNGATRSYRSSTAIPKDSGRSDLRLSESISQEYAALFSIINQERAARIQLEEQVRDLQQSLSDMAYQLSQPLLVRRSEAGFQDRVSSAPTHYTNSVPNYSHVHSNLSYGGTAGQRLTSRFSLSESLTDSEAARLRASRETDAAELDTNRMHHTGIHMPLPMDARNPRITAVEGEMF